MKHSRIAVGRTFLVRDRHSGGMTGKQVRLFLVDGTASGLITAEIVNWTGHLIAAPRTELARLLERRESRSTGVYVLLGDDPTGVHEALAYIGEGDAIDERLRAHARPEEAGGKDFWDRVVVITSKDPNITKAHARYLEARLISLASGTQRAALANATAPPEHSLPEADLSDMEYFIEQLQIVLPVLGVSILRDTRPRAEQLASTDAPSPIARSGAVTGLTTSPEFRLRVGRNPDRFARAVEFDAQFVVQEGSYASAVTRVMPTAGYRAHRESLIEGGVLSPVEGQPEMLVATRDLVFDSVSAAASVMTGTSQNGRKQWVTEAGVTYGIWQDSAR